MSNDTLVSQEYNAVEISFENKVLTCLGLAKPFLSLKHSEIEKIVIHTVMRSYFQWENCAKVSKIYEALANAQAARILAPLYLLIFNSN